MDKSIIKKSNQFVEALYDASLWELRLLLKMLSQINKEDEDFKEYVIDMAEIKKDFKIENDGSAYNRIRKAARALMKKSVIIRNKLSDGSFDEVEIPIISEIGSNTVNRSFLKTSFHPKMKPYLLQLKSEFLTYEAIHVLELPSPYAIRLYEICRQYQKIGKRIMKVEELKRMIGIEGKYKQYSHLRERILEPAVSSINEKTDIFVEFEVQKKNRKADSIIFSINRKRGGEPEQVSSEFFGISATVLAKWREQYDEAHIQARVDYVNEQLAGGTEIKNKAGYLASIMDKKLTETKASAPVVDISKKVNAILYSNPIAQKQIEAKYGFLSQEALNSVVRKMFPEKFE